MLCGEGGAHVRGQEANEPPGVLEAGRRGACGCGAPSGWRGVRRGRGVRRERDRLAGDPFLLSQAPDPKRVDYLNQSISGWEESYGEFAINPLISSSDVTVAMARLLKQANEDRAPD